MSSASTSNGISSSANARRSPGGPGPRHVQSVHRAAAPHIENSLTDCSVYASVRAVTSTRPIPRTADAVVVGGGTIGAWCAWFLRRVRAPRRRARRGGHAGLRAPASGPPAWCVRKAAPRRPFGWACSAASSTPVSSELLGIDSGFVAAGLLHAVLHRGRGRGGARADRDAAGARARRALGRPRRVRRLEPALAPGRPSARRTPPEDGYIDPPHATCSPTPPHCSPPVSTSPSDTSFTGLRTLAAP